MIPRAAFRIGLIPLLACFAATVAAESPSRNAVREAMAAAGKVQAQAEALARLAWPDTGDHDSQVAALARKQLVGFGDRGLDAMRASLRRAPARYSADIVSAILETRLVVTFNLPTVYLAAVEDALWFGTADAKRIAIPELAVHGYTPALLATIDTAYEHPTLVHVVIGALPRFRSDRARFFLGEQLDRGSDDVRRAAARSLAEIGGRCIEVLRDATLDPRELVRHASIDALIPRSSVEDLTILYEYIAQYPRDDPERIESVIQRAIVLESALESYQAQESASGGD